MESSYNPRYLIHAEGQAALLAQQLNRLLDDVDTRLNELEAEKKAKKKGAVKPTANRAMKMALLHELGVLDYLLGLGISQKKIAVLLNIVIGASEANVEKDLSTRHNRDATFKNEEAYNFVAQLFHDNGLSTQEDKSRKTLELIQELKEQKNRTLR